jgi:hypothetical protein
MIISTNLTNLAKMPPLQSQSAQNRASAVTIKFRPGSFTPEP